MGGTRGGTVYDLSLRQARAIWLRAQRLTENAPFGAGTGAVQRAIEHLGYVQIDTINVIERCHHHILFNRIPEYRREDLHNALSTDKSIFEYWTHALSFVPVRDFPHFVGQMRRHRKSEDWQSAVSPKDLERVIRLIRKQGATSIRDIEDKVLVDKSHPWASRKPSKAALQRAFYNGHLTVSAREGMLKHYELTERHFGWDRLPRAASSLATHNYLLDRALRSQGCVSIESICYLDAQRKAAIKSLIEKRVRARTLVPVRVEGSDTADLWAEPETLECVTEPSNTLTHILSPFDPLIIQRKRTARIFGYEHLFEAYVSPSKRRMGYFTLPVLHCDEIVAAIDLKADRAKKQLLIQAWHWVGEGDEKQHRAAIEDALDRFAAFQFA